MTYSIRWSILKRTDSSTGIHTVFSPNWSKYAQIDSKMQEKWNHPLQILYILLLKHIRLQFSSLLMQDFPLDNVFKKELY